METLCSALICAFKLVLHRQINTVQVPPHRQGPLVTGHASHSFKLPQHPSFGEDAHCCSSLALHPVKEVPVDLLNNFHHLRAMNAMRRWRTASTYFLQCGMLTAQPEAIQLFFNYNSSISCHVNNSQYLEEKRVWEEANYCAGVMESWKTLSIAGTAKHSCRHWKQHVLS